MFGSESGQINISNGEYTNDNGAYKVDIYVVRGSLSLPAVASGTWQFRLKSKTSGTKRVDCWLVSEELSLADLYFVDGMTERMLVGSPATADGVIAVGAYTTKKRWTNAYGGSYSYWGAVEGGIVDYSSPGPRTDGELLPHISGPGQGVVGALSEDHTPTSSRLMPGLAHVIDSGTSASAAHVAGMASLILEQDPLTSPSQAISLLQFYAEPGPGQDPADPEDPEHILWGSGKLRAPSPEGSGVAPWAGTLEILAVGPNPFRESVAFDVSLSADEADLRVGVYLEVFDLQGRVLARVEGHPQLGEQRLLWDGRTPTGAKVAPGVYFGRVRVGDRSLVRKLVLVD
jgi:hypothetical protein